MTSAQRPKTIEEYAALQVALVHGPRDEVLRERGLDEDAVAEIDAEFQDALSAAMEEDCDGIPALLTAYDQGLRKARREVADGEPSAEVLSLDDFASLTRTLESSRDVKQAFDARGVTFEAYMRASEHWTPKLATDPELAKRFISARKK